ncbi:YkgJ family cysteine cluster protein [Desulfatitalea alkaliphila]|uniref:YkgJ family cysteine cluster protein n=1 Tax=Desulfatitalea alkaliphila TaxID=2929485 RepID=A0AA41QZA9_9BACT|nr:YkgJ family cysteine cluster protein [Desulfatitalea alkaliphila]MCJ8499114.1 YkgJ family cysteine cluster protein [Desulfatitalea alkaliphila]
MENQNTDNNSPAMARINPVRLGYDSRFQFKCHPGVSCFTLCCRGIDILLTPYDIIRLKTRLELSSAEFLAIYTEPHLLEKTDLPMVTLKKMDDEQASCPFVRDTGCLVYEDRPTACRYYPLGVASLQHQEGADDQGFFFFVNEPHCKGFEEACDWTVAEWRTDQGVDVRDAVNAEWTDLLVRKRSFPSSIKLTEKAKQMFFMVSYDVDKLRRFVFESSFLQRMPVAEDVRQQLASDDVALLQFGLRWFKDVLYKQRDPHAQAAAAGGDNVQ